MHTEKPAILIVDDIPANIRLLEAFLSPDYTIYGAQNGIDALSIAEHQIPDLILLDIMMPGMDGFELYGHIRKINALRQVPIFFVTSLNSTTNELCGLNLGADDYITKPFNLDIVSQKIKNHIDRKRERDRLEFIGFTDVLTTIANRRRFDEYLDIEWRRARRTGSTLSLLMIDIDHFKKFNDLYGHTVGDECLRAIAQTLNSGLNRAADLAARYGGEEFGCILPGSDGPGARTIAERLRKDVEALKLPPENYSATVSIGAASCVPSLETGLSVKELIQQADAALYAAKAEGRNRVCTMPGLETEGK